MNKFIIGQLVAVYWGKDDDGEHEFYTGVIRSVSESGLIVRLNSGTDEKIAKGDYASLVPLATRLSGTLSYDIKTITHARLKEKTAVLTWGSVKGFEGGEIISDADGNEFVVVTVKDEYVDATPKLGNTISKSRRDTLRFELRGKDDQHRGGYDRRKLYYSGKNFYNL